MFFSIITFTILIFLIVTADTHNTDNPLPTKTPIGQTENTESETELDTLQIVISQPYTQSDLQLLTGNVLRPNGMYFFENELFISCTGDSTLYVVSAENGDTAVHTRGIRNSHSLYIEANDVDYTMWIADYDGDVILRVDNGSSPSEVIRDIESPWGIAYLDEDYFLVTSLISNSLYRINRVGERTLLSDELRSPTGVAVNDDVIFVANNGSSRQAIQWMNVDDLFSEDHAVETLISGIQSVTGLVYANDDMLYFSYSIGTRGAVGRIDPLICIENGGCTNDQIEIVIFTDLMAPLAGLTLSPDMRLYIHTIYQPEIYWIDLKQN